MITASACSAQPSSWQQLWRESITDPEELLSLLGLQHLIKTRTTSSSHFTLRVPRGFVARMKPGDPEDPLLLQVLPQTVEQIQTAGYVLDAVGDLASRAAPGVLHKYQGRALLISTGACAVHCRYCFRRHFPYTTETAASQQWREAIRLLQDDTSIQEVILSGGDPLSLATAKLTELTAQLSDIPHIRRLRLHTRLPVVLPERVDSEFCDWLASLPWPIVVVLHVNHANELNTAVAQACAQLRKAGAALLNQSVLLRGINDSVEALTALSEALLVQGVLPYYLHQLDRVQGTAHFEVSDTHARALLKQLRIQLPGYLVPRLVRETAGFTYKLPLDTES